MDTDETIERYREIRALLEQLVASWPWDRPGTAFENAKVYLDFHCVDCGTKLSVNDLAVVLELEMLRLGTVDMRKVPYYNPICARCYIRRAEPECRSAAHRMDWADEMDAHRLPDMRATGHVALQPSADTFHALALQSTAGTTYEHPAPLGSSLLQAPVQDAASSQPPRFNRAWWWRHTGECLLLAAALLIVLALGMALISIPRQIHTSTLSRPTAPATPTTVAPRLQPRSQSFRAGSRRARAGGQAAGVLNTTRAV